MKKVKLITVFITATTLIVITHFIGNNLLNSPNAIHDISQEESSEEKANTALTSKMGPMDEPKLILDADEISNVTIDYDNKISFEAIINNEPVFENYYDKIIQSIDALSEEIENFPFYQETGYYISKTPIYHFDVKENTMSKEVQIILFSKDLETQANLILFLNNNGEIVTNISFPFTNIKVLKNSPNEPYIFLYNNNELILDSNNKLYPWSRQKIEVKGDYYHTLNYEMLGISYTSLTDVNNMVWVDLN